MLWEHIFINKGELYSRGRIFVEGNHLRSILDRVVEETKKMKIGDPLDRSTQLDHKTI